ncbi:MAG: hypothetical protein DRQ47_02110, partial [Gammaproteobacteria bacterium]
MKSIFCRANPLSFYAYLFIFLACNFTVASQAATLSGVIKDKTGSPIVGANAMLFELNGQSLSQVGEIIQVSQTGQYSWDVTDGSYVVRAYFNASDVDLAGAPNVALVQSEDFVVEGNTVRDSVFNFYLLTGQVVDSNNLPISNVDLNISKTWYGPEIGSSELSQHNIRHSNGSTMTDVNGQYSALVFSTDTCIASGHYPTEEECLYDITFKPLASSGFTTEYELDYGVTGDQNLNIELSISDQITPKILLGPYVKNITDISVELEWITDEATNSSVDIATVGTFSSDNFSIYHNITVTELSANNSYTAQVSSSDAQGNTVGPVSKDFTSGASPDLVD